MRIDRHGLIAVPNTASSFTSASRPSGSRGISAPPTACVQGTCTTNSSAT
jgi:hypothetical protein